MRNRILAVDPGGTTGFATLTSRSTWVAEEFDFRNFTKFVDGVADELCVIVAESYTITGQTLQKSRQYTALETIGFLRYVALRENIPFVLQGSAMKLFGSDDRLKSIGWYISGKGHANDASRHLLHYACKRKIVEIPKVCKGWAESDLEHRAHVVAESELA